MIPTITITEEAQAFFARNPDPALQRLIDLAIREYSAFMGGLPIVVDAFDEEGTDHVAVSIGVEADGSKGSMLKGHHEFMNGWRSRHSREECRAVGFSIRYL